jgi:hypothetical protein
MVSTEGSESRRLACLVVGDSLSPLMTTVVTGEVLFYRRLRVVGKCLATAFFTGDPIPKTY